MRLVINRIKQINRNMRKYIKNRLTKMQYNINIVKNDKFGGDIVNICSLIKNKEK